MGVRLRCMAAVVALLSLAFVDVAAAQPLTDNDFVIDAAGSPVLGSSRVIGMGGAYAALAQGVDGAGFNPASYASRAIHELDWFEWDVALSLGFPGVLGKDDFFNAGQSSASTEDMLFVDAGGRLQFGNFGLGFLARLLDYNIPPTLTSDAEFDVQLVSTFFGLGYGFWDGQLVVGLGGRLSVLNMNDISGSTGAASVELIELTGLGIDVGGLLRLEGQPWRVGVTARTPVNSTLADTTMAVPEQIGGFFIPEAVHSPWEIQVGFAYQLGRPFNTRYQPQKDPSIALVRRLRDAQCARELAQLLDELQAAGRPAPEDLACPRLRERPEDETWWVAERERRREERRALGVAVEMAEEEIAAAREEELAGLARPYLLLSAEVRLIGRTENGIGIGAFFDQERRERGDQNTFVFHLGAEAEPWDDRLKVRVGSYLEAGRQAGVASRLHATVGADLRLFRILRWDVRGTLTADGAARYLNLSVGVGIWH